MLVVSAVGLWRSEGHIFVKCKPLFLGLSFLVWMLSRLAQVLLILQATIQILRPPASPSWHLSPPGLFLSLNSCGLAPGQLPWQCALPLLRHFPLFVRLPFPRTGHASRLTLAPVLGTVLDTL